MPDGTHSILAFGPFRLFPAERRLEKESSPIPIGGRALDLLVLLVERAGEVVSNRTLIETVWRDVNVDEASLRFHIKRLRKVLDDSRPDNRYVKNVPGRGYCFVAPVTQLGGADGTTLDSGPPSARASLPTHGSEVIGRSDSIETLSRELSRRRLVTVVGPGGIGKTTLAIVIAETLRSTFRNGVVFIDLAPIEDPSLVGSAVTVALGLTLRADDPLSQVVDFLRDKRILIVLDNCEQVVEAVAQLADRILRDLNDAHMLITSRESLRIAGERVHRLMPLECPPSKADITAKEAMSYAAVQLFVDRATASVDDFSLNDDLAPATAEICRRLDGIPLAIELATARLEFFGVAALAKALNDMFAVLTQGRRLALPRHQTLRATLDWGYNLLSPQEQTVLRRLAVFRAQFSLESALEVVAGLGVSIAGAADAMAGLVAKSLVVTDREGRNTRYRLLETTRLYAGEKLAATGESHELARRHADHLLKLFTNPPGDRDTDPEVARQWPDPGRIADVRGAIDWSFSQDGELALGLDLIAASGPLWFRLSLSLEYRRRVERALRFLSNLSERDPLVEMRLQIALGHALWYTQDDAELLQETFARALELADRIDAAPDRLRLQALWGMWAARRGRGQYREALAVATRYEAVARSVGDQAFVLLGDRILGLTHHFLGNQDLARQHMEQVRRIARGSENPPNTEFQLSPEVAAASLLTRILWLQGFPDQAMAMLGEAVEAAQSSSNQFSMSYVLFFAACPASLWIGNLSETQKYLDLLAQIDPGYESIDQLRGFLALVLRLRQGDERDALIASYIEPRLDLSTLSQIAALGSASTIAMPPPNDEVGDALWSLPEVLRVKAELLLWHDAHGAADAAEAELFRSIDLARQQSALSWELRAVTSLGRLWGRCGHVARARDLVAAVCDRFTEGFATSDLMKARRLIAEWS
jgi:predicted ATPase/DNA-binding winged helix-turn-helix (wHTH) protein